MREPCGPSRRTIRPLRAPSRGSASLKAAEVFFSSSVYRSGYGRQVAVGQLAQARQAFVPGVIAIEVQALQVWAALPAAVQPGEEGLGVLPEAFADDQGAARHAAGFVDQGCGSGPVGFVERGFVQRHQDAVERVLQAHGVGLPDCPWVQSFTG